MSRLYIYLLGFAAVTIAVTSASFSVFGLAQLFAGASTAVIFMASALEFAKFVCTGFLYRYWGHINRPIRYYLTGSVLTLMLITSMGIYGFLANAYQITSIAWKADLLKIQALKDEDARLAGQVQEFRAFVDAIPPNRISRKYEFQKIYDPKIEEIGKKRTEIHAKITASQLEMQATHTKIGPITFVAEALHMEVDTVVRILMLLFVMVFDPLAVCLVFCWSLTVRLREKYRGDEAKIASRNLMTDPVDHRFRKAG